MSACARVCIYTHRQAHAHTDGRRLGPARNSQPGRSRSAGRAAFSAQPAVRAEFGDAPSPRGRPPRSPPRPAPRAAWGSPSARLSARSPRAGRAAGLAALPAPGPAGGARPGVRERSLCCRESCSSLATKWRRAKTTPPGVPCAPPVLAVDWPLRERSPRRRPPLCPSAVGFPLLRACLPPPRGVRWCRRGALGRAPPAGGGGTAGSRVGRRWRRRRRWWRRKFIAEGGAEGSPAPCEPAGTHVSGLPEEAGGSSVLWYRALFAPRGAHVPGLWASPPAPCVQLLPGRRAASVSRNGSVNKSYGGNWARGEPCIFREGTELWEGGIAWRGRRESSDGFLVRRQEGCCTLLVLCSAAHCKVRERRRCITVRIFMCYHRFSSLHPECSFPSVLYSAAS